MPSTVPGPPEQWQVQASPVPGAPVYFQPVGAELRPTASVVSVLRVLVILHLIVAAVRVGMNFRLYQQFSAPEGPNPDTFDLYDLSLAVELLFVLLLFGAGISTMVLLWRMLKNGEVLAPNVGDHKPHWAITGWIVPFLNFVRPRHVVDQAWVTSRTFGERIPPTPAPPSASYWWGSFVIYLLVDRVTPTAPFNNPTTSDYANESLGITISSVLVLIAGVLFLRVLGELQTRHQAALDNPWVDPRTSTANPFVQGTPTIAPPPPAAQTSPGFGLGAPAVPVGLEGQGPAAIPPAGPSGNGFSQPR